MIKEDEVLEGVDDVLEEGEAAEARARGEAVEREKVLDAAAVKADSAMSSLYDISSIFWKRDRECINELKTNLAWLSIPDRVRYFE